MTCRFLKTVPDPGYSWLKTSRGEQPSRGLDKVLQHWNFFGYITSGDLYVDPTETIDIFSRSLTHQSRLTLVHAFVTSRIDCCCSLLAGLPLGALARLDRVLRSAARLIGGLSQVFFHHCLHA